MSSAVARTTYSRMVTSAASVWLALALSVGQTGAPYPELVPTERFRPAPWGDLMRDAITDVRGRFSGRLYLYVSDPWRGYQFGHQADRPAYLASGVKMAFMVEVYRQRKLGQLSFGEELAYSEADIRDGAPRINKLKLGARLSIRTLLEWMMRSSDNAASDMLAKRVGLSHVNEGLEAEGVGGFSPLTYLVDVRRGVYRELDVTADDLTPQEVRAIRWTPIWEPQLRKLEQLLGRQPLSLSKARLHAAYDRYYATGVNAAPMASVGLLLEKLCRGELVSPKASHAMLELMSSARTSTNRLMGQLPEGTRVAHKTGSQFRRVCDMGVITLPDSHPLIVAACTESDDVNGSEQAIAKLARAAYDLALKDHREL